MKTIWKYPLMITDIQKIKVPMGAVPLCVGTDPSNGPCIWCEVDDQSPAIPLEVYVVGTGNPLPEDVSRYIGSIRKDPFIWHVYV